MEIIDTPNAPEAIGTYSQAVKVNETVYLSGQIPLDKDTKQLIDGNIEAQIEQVFLNLKAVCEAAGGSLKSCVKLNVYLTDLTNFALVNEVMGRFYDAPYPARAAIEVKALPKRAQIEIDGIMVIQ